MWLTTKQPTFLYEFQFDGTRIVCPIAERQYAGQIDIVTPFGFSGFASNGQSTEFSQSWLRFARDREWVCGYIGLNPFLKLPASYLPADIYQENELYFLDLSLSEAELHRRLSKGRKRQLRSWNRHASWLCTDRQMIIDFIIAQSDSFFRSRGASSAYAFAPATWCSFLSLDNVELLGAARAGRIIAAIVFAHATSIADALFNISLPEGKDAQAPLLWEGALRLRSRGICTLNLGGGIRRGDNVGQSKRYYGAHVVPLQCLKQVYDPHRFTELCRIAGVDPSRRAGYFPPYRMAGTV